MGFRRRVNFRKYHSHQQSHNQQGHNQQGHNQQGHNQQGQNVNPHNGPNQQLMGKKREREEVVNLNDTEEVDKFMALKKKMYGPNTTPNGVHTNGVTPTDESGVQIDTVNISQGLFLKEHQGVECRISTKNEHKFVFADLNLNDKSAEWKIRINKRSTWLAFGACMKDKIVQNNLKLGMGGLGGLQHGLYVMSVNGYSWSNNNSSENNNKIPGYANIQEGDIVSMSYNAQQTTLTFKTDKFSYTLKNVIGENNALVPCVIFMNFGDSVNFSF